MLKRNKGLHSGCEFVAALFVSLTGLVLSGVSVPVQAEDGYSQVNAILKDTISIGVTSDNIVFQITPTGEGVFDMKSTDIDVWTNAAGYSLYISADDDKTAMKHTNPSISSAINPLGAGVATDAVGTGFPANEWGYSADGTNFYGVSTDYQRFKTHDGQLPGGHDVASIYFGTKINAGVTAGTYNTTVIITATPTVVPPMPPVIGAEGDDWDSDKWVNTATITPEIAGAAKFGVDYYEYYVLPVNDSDVVSMNSGSVMTSADTSKPQVVLASNVASPKIALAASNTYPALPDEFDATGEGDSVVINHENGYEDGVYLIYFRTVDKVGAKSSWSEPVQVKLDGTAPALTVNTVTADLAADKQNISFTCEDERSGVAGYYFNKDSNQRYYSIVDAFRWDATVEVDSAGTYKIFCRDKAGNVSGDTYNSITYYKYTVNNVLNTISGVAGTYNGANYISKSISSEYIAPAGTQIDVTAVYDVPNPESAANRYLGASTSYDNTNVSSLTTSTIPLNSNMNIYAWFNRNMYNLILNSGEGIASTSGAGSYKYGQTANIDATVDTAREYSWDKWTKQSGNDPASLSNKSTSVTLTMDTVLTANGKDESAPKVTAIERSAYNTITFTITDNSGLAAYCVTNSATKPDTCADGAISGTSYNGTKVIFSANTWYVWGKDVNGNITEAANSKNISSYAVTRSATNASLVTKYDATNASSGTEFTNTIYALAGTDLYISASPTGNYDSTTLTYGGTGITNPSTQKVNGNVEIKAVGIDTIAPVVTSISRQTTAGNYDKVNFTITDSLGVTAYCVTIVNSADGCASATGNTKVAWTNVTSTTSYSGTFTVNSANTYYVWGRDASNNVTTTVNTKSMAAYSVSRSQGTGTTLVTKLNGGAVTASPVYATANTPVTVTVTRNTAYYVSGMTYNSTDILLTAGTSGYNQNVTANTSIVSSGAIAKFENLVYMQDLTSAICTNQSVGSTGILEDRRDGKLYYVTREADGHCWMTQNLDLDLTVSGSTMGNKDSSGAHVALSSTYTDLNTANWTIPNGSVGYATQTDTSRMWNEYGCVNSPADALWNDSNYNSASFCNNGYEARSYDPGNVCLPYNGTFTNADSLRSCSTLPDMADHTKYGNKYNWPAATAGSGNYQISTIYTNATNSICPKGWKLPNGPQNAGTSGQFGTLFTSAGLISNGNTRTPMTATLMSQLTSEPLWFVRADRTGEGCPGLFCVDYRWGYYWTSTAYGNGASFGLQFDGSDLADFGMLTPDIYAHGKGYGMSVRCLL